MCNAQSTICMPPRQGVNTVLETVIENTICRENDKVTSFVDHGPRNLIIYLGSEYLYQFL